MEFGDEGQSLARLTRAVDAARDCGFAAVSANDHFLFQTPWLDGPTALAAVIERSGAMELATTVALVALRGPVPLAKTLAALDLLSDGRVIAGVGPGSSERDYDAVGVPYEERWERFDEAAAILRSLLRDDPPPETRRHYPLPGSQLAPAPRRPGGIPLWIGSWGSKAGLRRVARLGDGWLASAYNTTPDGFKAAKQSLSEQLRRPRQGSRSVPQRARDDVDLDHRRRRATRTACCERSWPRCSSAIQMPCATSCASDQRSNARNCSHATRKQAVSASTSGRSATSLSRSSSRRRPCFRPSRRTEPA